MTDGPELRLELLKIAARVVGSHSALMKVAEELRSYVLAPEIAPRLPPEALWPNEMGSLHDD